MSSREELGKTTRAITEICLLLKTQKQYLMTRQNSAIIIKGNYVPRIS